jgi:hypothetical protein
VRWLFLSRLWPLLNRALFFEAAGAVSKIGSSLKSNHHWNTLYHLKSQTMVLMFSELFSNLFFSIFIEQFFSKSKKHSTHQAKIFHIFWPKTQTMRRSRRTYLWGYLAKTLLPKLFWADNRNKFLSFGRTIKWYRGPF